MIHFRRSLQWRLVIIFILIPLVLIVSVHFYLNREIESSYYEIFKQQIENGFKNWQITDRNTAKDLQEFLGNRGNAVVYFYINDFRSYTIINKNTNEMIGSFDPVIKNKSSSQILQEILKSDNFMSAMVGETGDKYKLISSDEGGYFDYARSVKLADGEFILYFRYYDAEWYSIIEHFSRFILSSLMIAIISALVLGYILSKTITVPIVNIMHKARGVAAGDFGQPLEVKSEDEIGELTKTFNYMAKELKKNLIEISSEKNKVETILNYMTDGILAFNHKGALIHINPSAKNILGADAENCTFNEFSEKYALGVSLEEVLYLDSISTREKDIKRNDKFLRVYFALFTDEEKKAEGIIAVIHDITEEQKLENMRREFVANVSHELRTPLTSIKSYTETLLDGGGLEDRETAVRFLGVVNSEADRMTRLVRDLLQLSRLDNMQIQWRMQEISFVDLVRNAVEKMRISAANKKQKLESYVIGEIPAIKADRDRIEQVVMNILSNAIKYTQSGGEINVYIGRTHSEVYMKVADNGIGIPAADLPRIFERFYRVDKARSREMGGTGLGLAIAKEIVDLHGGEISVASEEGKGTEITVKLPVG